MLAKDSSAVAVPESGPAPSTLYRVSVRALCEFAAKRGDLDRRFSPSPSAQEGMAGHRTVAATRTGGYKSEVALSAVYRGLLVRGRADGYDRDAELVEEVKTFRGDPAPIPEHRSALHLAQANTYAAMLCQRDGLDGLSVAVVYFDVDRGVERTTSLQRRSATDLRLEFEALCDAFMDWAIGESGHRRARDDWLDRLRFPHAAFRTGQHALAGAVWRAVRQERCLVAEASTGIGKSVATLFPAMKSMVGGHIDRIFFLTARTTGRRVALDAAEVIRRSNPDAAFRVLELTARDKACEHPDKTCDGESCPLARGFYDRLPAARRSARDRAVLDRGALRDVALAHGICPYYLGTEMARWCDVVVGDYNHWFDGYPLLAALVDENDWRAAVLVDEAHNLPDRARAMYSQRLSGHRLRAAKKGADGAIAKSLTRLTRAWNRLTVDVSGPYLVFTGPPVALLRALNGFTEAVDDVIADRPYGVAPQVLDLYLDALRLCRLAASFDSHSVFDVTIDRIGPRRETTIGIRNLFPAPFLTPRHAAARSTVFFSATLTPHRFYTDLLGLPDDTVRIDIPSPFSPEQLSVRVVRHISTRLQHRGRSIEPLADLVGQAFGRAPGNYLVFLGSHAYLQQLADVFMARYPTIACWLQTRSMSEADRDAYLRNFQPGGQGIGFAVLGGVFAEGVDLPGDRLVGAFVATLGMPQFDEVNEEHRQRFEARYGAGFEYTYLYPGIRRVVQAAGRVIRSTSDRGSLHLVDDRYATPAVRALLPAWWQVDERR